MLMLYTTKQNFLEVPWMRSRLCMNLISWQSEINFSCKRRKPWRVSLKKARILRIKDSNKSQSRTRLLNRIWRLWKSSWYRPKLQRNNSEQNCKNLIVLTMIRSKSKKQRHYRQVRRSKELREIRKDLQPKWTSYSRATSNWRRATKVY